MKESRQVKGSSAADIVMLDRGGLRTHLVAGGSRKCVGSSPN